MLDTGIIYKLDIYTKRIKSISEISGIIAELLNFNLDDSRLLAVFLQDKRVHYREQCQVIENLLLRFIDE